MIEGRAAGRGGPRRRRRVRAQVEEIGRRAVARFGRSTRGSTTPPSASTPTGELTEPEEMDRVAGVNLLGVDVRLEAARACVQDRRRDDRQRRLRPVRSGDPTPVGVRRLKHGVAGFSEALRLELARGDAGIDVVLIMPSSINTPLFNWARSKLASSRSRFRRSTTHGRSPRRSSTPQSTAAARSWWAAGARC